MAAAASGCTYIHNTSDRFVVRSLGALTPTVRGTLQLWANTSVVETGKTDREREN